MGDIEQTVLASGTLQPFLLVDVGSALMWHRLAITDSPLDDDLPQRIVDQFLPLNYRRDDG